MMVCIAWGLMAGAFPLQAGTPARVFILHSYEYDHVCGRPQHDGVLAGLRHAGYRQGENLELRLYCMDTKKTNNTPELIARQACLARQAIAAWRPDVLVTLDDNAFASVGLAYVDTSLPVVFCGLNRQPGFYDRQVHLLESRRRPGHNITGVIEKLHVSDALRVQARLLPGVQGVEFIVDRSNTGQALREQIERELAADAPPCTWSLVVVDSWEEYRAEIRRVNQDRAIGAIYPAALLLKDRDGQTYTAPEIFAWTTAVSLKPELALNQSFTRLGLFGGVAVDFFAMGEQAGRMAARILGGEAAGAIGIEDARRYALAFHLGRARELGIDLPADVILAAEVVITGQE